MLADNHDIAVAKMQENITKPLEEMYQQALPFPPFRNANSPAQFVQVNKRLVGQGVQLETALKVSCVLAAMNGFGALGMGYG